MGFVGRQPTWRLSWLAKPFQTKWSLVYIFLTVDNMLTCLFRSRLLPDELPIFWPTCLNILWEATKRNQGWKLGQLTSKSTPKKKTKFWRHLTTTSPKDNHKMVRILVGLRGFFRHFNHGRNSPFGDLDLDRWVKLCLFQLDFQFLFPKKIPTRWAPYQL